LSQIKGVDFAGYDPFDYLNSSLFRSAGLTGSHWARLAWLQFGKRFPINIRPLIGVPRRRNPKGCALMILGMLEDFKRNAYNDLLVDASQLADWLLTQMSDQSVWNYPCWGYHFDWQARAFYVPKGKPNIITTCYVSRALYDLGTVLDREDYRQVALNAAYFIDRHLLSEADGRTFFAYIPQESAFVHNASLWGAAWVAFSGAKLGDQELQETALKVARQSVQEQRPDGSWVYGTRHHHQFIDGFHTGYNLEALDIIRKELNLTEFDDPITLGLDYYRDTLFQEDGTAKYYHDNVFPLDMHSFSQGVLTLLKVGRTEGDVLLAHKILTRAVETMYLSEQKQFIYQKHRWYSNRINYIRWTQAWAYYGLAYFNRFMAEYQNETH